jgi:hypothetical protein
MVPKIFWSASAWRKGTIVNQARFAPRRDRPGSLRSANRSLMRIASPIPRSPPILMGDWCSEEVTDTRTQRNYGNGRETLNHSAGSITARRLSRETPFPLRRRDFSLDRVPFDGCLLMGDPPRNPSPQNVKRPSGLVPWRLPERPKNRSATKWCFVA